MKPTDFYGAAKSMPADAIVNAATAMQVEPAVLQAIVYQESHGKSFLPDGRPTILFEPHVFHLLTSGKYDNVAPSGISVKDQGSVTYGPAGAYQYDKLQAAMALDEDAALRSASWGFWQCMGRNYSMLGYASVQDMVTAFCASEGSQLQGFVAYLKERGLIPAMQAKDWATIAYKYNGPNYRVNQYDTKLQQYYNEHAKNILQQGSSGPKVTQLQQMLVLQGFKIATDGLFGPDTTAALKAFQSAHGLTADGVAGPATFQVLAAVRVPVTPIHKSKRVAGGIVAGGTGLGTLASTLSSMVSDSTDAVHKAATNIAVGDASHHTQGAIAVAHQYLTETAIDHYVMAGEALVIVALAGYMIWTKIVDNKKARGVIQ